MPTLWVLWLQDKVPYAALLAIYLLTLVAIGGLLWWLTGHAGLVTTVESVLVVLGALLLGAAWPGRRAGRG